MVVYGGISEVVSEVVYGGNSERMPDEWEHSTGTTVRQQDHTHVAPSYRGINMAALFFSPFCRVLLVLVVSLVPLAHL